MKILCITLLTAILTCNCTIVKYQTEQIEFLWISTKKVKISSPDITLETDPDAQYQLLGKITDLAKTASAVR